MNSDRKLLPAIPVREAAQHAPALAHLSRLVQESQNRFQMIQPLLPESLRDSVQAGPLEAVDGEHWCLLVSNNAAAAKIRQLLPRLQTRLQNAGYKLTSIRLKILTAKHPA